MRECEDHGYFREDQCPVCGEEGKFIMNDFETERLGRSLAGILRHGRFDLSMDDQGFVDMRDIVGVIKEKNPRMHWPQAASYSGAGGHGSPKEDTRCPGTS